jgi:hypothetical protein
MTDAEWLNCRNPELMLTDLGDRASPRKLRLFACATCRRLWHVLPDERSRKAVEVSELFADGLADARALRAAAKDAARAQTAAREARTLSWNAALTAQTAAEDDPVAAARRAALTGADTDMVREVFGNPYRPVAIEPAWRTWNDGCVVRLARAIYEERRFRELPILADALMDAGCDREELLDHCRSLGPHYRGCWVVDALRGTAF